MLYFILPITLLFIGAAIRGMIGLLQNNYRRSFPRLLVAALAGVLLVTGMTGFFAHIYSYCGVFEALGLEFEWPAGLAEGVITLPDGRRVVPINPGARIQIYDHNWKYLRGWRIESPNSDFIMLHKNGLLKIYCVKSPKKTFMYNLDGKLLEEGKYDNLDELNRKDVEAQNDSLTLFVPTPWYLLPFSHPLAGFATVLAGGFLILVFKMGDEEPENEKKK